jgi:hypothetical protein
MALLPDTPSIHLRRNMAQGRDFAHLIEVLYWGISIGRGGGRFGGGGTHVVVSLKAWGTDYPRLDHLAPQQKEGVPQPWPPGLTSGPKSLELKVAMIDDFVIVRRASSRLGVTG